MTAGAGFALETDLSRGVADGHVDPTCKHSRSAARRSPTPGRTAKKTMPFLHGFEDADVGRYLENNVDSFAS